ncbi:MAG: phosphoribosylglycinamide formyltransferase [Campylobacterales bacterium]|nr:phosphoribosylglycinamide formyltransferase [Campylobacterales bacterium]
MKIKKIAILFSGIGTNLENIVRTLHNREFFDFKIEVCVAITNNPTALGIEKAKEHGVEVVVLNHKEFCDRESFDKELVKVIKSFDVDLTILAGFMRILTPVFIENVKAINIHPSILPLFKGANAIVESYNSNMKIAGVTIHEVSLELDSGKILAQQCIQKIENESFESFKQRVHELEREMYPKAILDYLVKL